MPLNIHAATMHIYLWLHFYCHVHIDPRLLHISTKNKKNFCNIYLLYYCTICASNKYIPQMPYICHMPILFDVHQLGKHANIYATYEVNGISHVTNSTVQRWWWWWWWWTMMQNSDTAWLHILSWELDQISQQRNPEPENKTQWLGVASVVDNNLRKRKLQRDWTLLQLRQHQKLLLCQNGKITITVSFFIQHLLKLTRSYLKHLFIHLFYL